MRSASATMDLPSGVSSATEASSAACASSSRRMALHRDELARHAVAEGDRAGLVQQQHVHVARRLDGAPAHRQHVALHQPVHARDADGRQQRADGRRDQRDQQRHQRDDRDQRVGIAGERPQRDDHDQEDDRQAHQQDVQGDLVGRLLAGRALDQGDHAVQEGLPRLGGDARGSASR